MSREPTELEWLGFELSLRRHFLGSDPQSTILARLCRNAGLTVRNERLLVGTGQSEDCIKVYVCHLRDAMSDLGFEGKIETVKGVGYRLSESCAAEVWGRVLTTVRYLQEAA